MKLLLNKKILVIAALLVAALISYSFFPSEKVDFSADVKPILNKKCISCHGGVKAKGRFSVLFQEEAMGKTDVNDDGLAKLQTLQQLQSLNLAGTKVTAQGVIKLNKLTSLKNLYLYCTEVKGADWSSLKKAFPSANLDSGKYQVPTFANDTTVVKFQ